MAVYCMESVPGLRKRRCHHNSAEEGSVYLRALNFFAFFSLQGIETFSHFDCFKKAFRITSGFCPVLSRREKDECARTPKRKGDVGPSSGRQGAGQRAGGASSARLFGFESSCHPVVLTSPQRQGYRGDGCNGAAPTAGRILLVTQFTALGRFRHTLGSGVCALSGQSEFPDLVVR